MKQSMYLLISLVLLLIFSVGCQVDDQPDTKPGQESKTKTRLIEPVASESVNTEGMTKLREFSNDLDSDGIEEKIELYAAADKNGKGEMMWDDGQNWLLAVRDGEKSYPLLSQYVQLGQMYFTVSNSGVDQIPNITVIIPTGSSFSVIGYTFDNGRNGFNEEQLYISKDDNWVYNSIPSY